MAIQTKAKNPMAKKTASQTKTAKTAAAKPGVEAMLNAHPNLKTTVAQIEKQFGEGAIMPLGAGVCGRIAGIPTGSLSLDMALGGQGIPVGASSRSSARNRAARPLWPYT